MHTLFDSVIEFTSITTTSATNFVNEVSKMISYHHQMISILFLSRLQKQQEVIFYSLILTSKHLNHHDRL